MDLRLRSATRLIFGLLLVACSENRPPGESARGIGPLAERMLSDRAADWLTFDVPGAAIHVRRGGLAAVQDLWKRATPPTEHPLGPDGTRLEEAWLDSLMGVRPATLDVPRLLREGC